MNEEPLSSASARDSTGFLAWLARLLAPYAPQCWLAGLAILVQVAFKVLVPVGYQEIFDGAIAGGDRLLLYTVLAALLGGWLINGLAGVAQDYLAGWIGSRAMRDLRERMFRQLQALSEGYFERVSSGDLMSRFSNDLAVIDEVVTRGSHVAFMSVLNLAGSLVLLFVFDWRLAAVTVVALITTYGLPRMLGARARDRAYEQKAAEAEVAAAIQERIGAHATVRVFDLGDYVSSNFRALQERLVAKTVAAQLSTALVGRAAGQSVIFVQVLVIGLGAWLAIRGSLSVGTLIGFAALMQNVGNAANHLANAVPAFLRASGGVRRVRDFLAEEPVAADAVDAEPLPRLSREIVFDRVRFAYDDGDPLLDELTLRIGAGESVALVGPSGSGKSTVLQLLLRLRKPKSGAILLDGVDLRRVDEKSLRDQVGIVLQETVLLEASFAENIRLGRLDASREEIIEAAELAKIHSVIVAKPEGYETLVGEGGRHLSVGQRQRIAIARAIVRDPAILVLDEATSALDPATEEAVNRTLKSVGRGRTVLSVTHRLASVVDADRILVMEDGNLVEQGRHRDLLALRGVYYRLWHKQSGFEVSKDGSRAMVTGTRLMQVPLLSGLGQLPLDAIAEHFSSKVFPQGRYVFHQGDIGDAFYVVVKGKVEVLESVGGSQERRAVLEDGDFFGELALLDAKPRNASIRALVSTLVVFIPRERFARFLEEQPGLRSTIEEKAKDRRSDASSLV